MPKTKSAPEPLVFFYQACGDVGAKYRWWRNTDAPDVFDLLKDDAALQVKIGGANMCRAKVIAHLPAFCDDGKCPDCLKYS